MSLDFRLQYAQKFAEFLKETIYDLIGPCINLPVADRSICPCSRLGHTLSELYAIGLYVTIRAIDRYMYRISYSWSVADFR